MGCITKLLESGAKRVSKGGSFVEGGGAYKGYEYLIVLNHFGHRCGYVAINQNHSLHKETSYDDSPIADIDMHGGCTFFGKQMTESECSDKWIGFDCGHYDDAQDIEALEKCAPEKAVLYKEASSLSEGMVRSKEYVEEQCKGIIDQLEAA